MCGVTTCLAFFFYLVFDSYKNITLSLESVSFCSQKKFLWCFLLIVYEQSTVFFELCSRSFLSTLTWHVWLPPFVSLHPLQSTTSKHCWLTIPNQLTKLHSVELKILMPNCNNTSDLIFAFFAQTSVCWVRVTSPKLVSCWYLHRLFFSHVFN